MKIVIHKVAKLETPPLLIDLLTAEFGNDPHIVLIGCLLSLRSRDSETIHVARKLFDLTKTPEKLLSLPVEKLESIIRPIGFFRTKAKVLRSVSQDLLYKFNGIVPKTKSELLSIKGIGRKTANLVLGIAFNIQAICIDVHVHRISNRLGLVNTKTPHKTEQKLMEILSRDLWITWNAKLVHHGQTIANPPKMQAMQT